MSENKTQPTSASVTEFLNSIENDRKRQDSFTLLEIMKEVTGEEPQMWGTSIIGFGRYYYEYASGRAGEWFVAGFSPRKQNLTLYIMSGFDNYETLLGQLGKYKTGKSCLYINKIADVDVVVLKELVAQSVAHMQASGENENG